MRERNAICRVFSSVSRAFGGISSTFSQNTDSLFDDKGVPENIRRRLWPLPGSIRASGGVSTKGALAVAGVEAASPLSTHACTSAGWPPSLLSLTVISFCFAGYTWRVPVITTLAMEEEQNSKARLNKNGRCSEDW